MSLPIEELTPQQVVRELDRYIVGQNAAKRAVAVALRNRYRRLQLPADERDDIMPKNILMMGPTGVGKTEIARRLAQLARAPFIKIEATKFTEVGYVGRDVESMVRDLAAAAVRLVEREKMEEVREEAERRGLQRVVDMLDDGPPEPESDPELELVESTDADEESPQPEGWFLNSPVFSGSMGFEDAEQREARQAQILEDLLAGKFDDREVEIETEEAANPFFQVFTPGGMEEMGMDSNPAASPFGSKRVYRRARVKEALPAIIEEEAKRMIDRSSLQREAVERAEQTGIIFIDEIDKVASKKDSSGPDVSREGVQRDLLPIIEGSTVATKFGPVRTDHVLFIAAGAFHMSKVSDLIPELQGRLPIRVELEALSEADFRLILSEPKNALTKQYQSLLKTDGVALTFSPDGLDEIAKIASEVNTKIENIGARRLHTIMERLLQDILFYAPESTQPEAHFDAARVREAFAETLKNTKLTQSVL